MDVTSIGVISWILPCVATIVTLSLCWKMNRIHTYWKKRGVPYADPVPIVGNLGFLLRRSVSEFFDEFWRKHPEDYVGLFMGWQPALVVQTPELARQVLVKHSEQFQDRYLYSDMSSDPLGALNLFTVKNPIWTQMRHGLSPMFTSARLKMLTELMNINARQLVQKVKDDFIDKNLPVNLKELFTMYTSDTVGYTVFGLRVSVLADRASPLWTITQHMVRWTFLRALEFHCVFMLPFIAKLMRAKFFSASATVYVKQLFWNVVKERQNSKTTNDKDLVNQLLKLKENLKLPAEADSQLAENLMMAQAAVFIFGSVDTSSTTLTYCLHELAHHPEIQDKLYQEVNEAMEQKGKEILEYDDLIDVKFLSACLYETLRKYPPVAYLDRRCNSAVTLDGGEGEGGVRVEPGVPVLVNVLAIHHDPRRWPRPEQWDPARPGAATSDNDNVDYTFLPFGDGPRFCIGKRYGMMQMRAALAQLIHKYRLEPAAGSSAHQMQADPYAVLLAPKHGGSVKFFAR